MRSSKSGTVLAATLVVTLAITLVLTGLVSWVNTESKVARRNLLQTKAQYGAEATAEYALAQIRCVLQQKPVITPNLFTTTGAITLPNSAVIGSTNSTVIAGVTGTGSSGYATNIASSLSTLQGGAAASSSRFLVTGTAINVGQFSSEANVLFSSTNDLYKNDPLRDQRVRTRMVKVIAAATATDTLRNESRTAYCEETLQVRDTALFSFISFYNMDLEVQPLPAMQVIGAIHTNRDLYVASSNSLDFYDVVTSAGNLHHGFASGVSGFTTNGGVSFMGSSGSLVSMKSGSTWIQSSTPNFKDLALTKWGGNLLSKAHGITPTVPAAVPAYVPDNPATSAYDPVNDAHDLIKPSVVVGSTNYPGDDTEITKFANQANLVLTVSNNPTTTSTTTYTTVTTGWGKNKKTTVVETVTTTVTNNLTTRLYKYVPSSTGNYMRPTSTGPARYDRVELSVPTSLVSKGEFYDPRQGENVVSADINIGVLKTAIEVPGLSLLMTNGLTTYNPNTEWNGIVYVEYDNPAQNSTTMGAVRLINGRYLPNKPTSANFHASGMTIATNAPLYIVGNYNADGTLPSDPTDIVDAETGEVPAAVAADAVTVLSTNWTIGNGSGAYDTLGGSSLSTRPAGTTEIATAIMTGLVPSNKQNNGIWSGGLNNIVRFIEDWNHSGSQKKIGLRGAVSVLYESETANKAWGSSYYDPPNRLFGLSQTFTDGSYPPGAPRARTYRRLGFRQLSASEYQTALANINNH